MVLVYTGAIPSSIGIGMHLPFATRSLGRAVNCLVYAAFLFCLPILQRDASGLDLAITFGAGVIVYWVIRRMLRPWLRRLWFRYLAFVLVEKERQTNPETVQERSGPRFEEAVSAAYAVIVSEHNSQGGPIGEKIQAFNRGELPESEMTAIRERLRQAGWK